jgi:hypothetical protein
MPGGMALIGVGNMFAALFHPETADALFSGLSTELTAEAVGMVEAVGRSSSVNTERACDVSSRKYGPRYKETESRLGAGAGGGWG